MRAVGDFDKSVTVPYTEKPVVDEFDLDRQIASTSYVQKLPQQPDRSSVY